MFQAKWKKIMYTLLSGLYKSLTQKDEFSVLILGLDNAGKTTFLESAKAHFTKGYKGVNPNKITATVGLNIGNIKADGIILNFWDLGGQEELQALWDKYYAGNDILISPSFLIFCINSNIYFGFTNFSSSRMSCNYLYSRFQWSWTNTRI